MVSYIPARDGDLDTWATTFSAAITAAPATYGLVAGDAAAIAAVYATWHVAYLLASNHATRTKPNVLAKDQARKNMLDLVRVYSMQIKMNAGVAPEAKTAIGLHTNDLDPTPIPAPSTSPILTIIGATPLQHTLRFADQDTPAKRAKPPGAIAIELRCQVATTQPTDPTAMPTVLISGRSLMAVTHIEANLGKLAWYVGRWVTRTGLTGPWSYFTSFTIA
jgi:hypothetical protein